VAPFSNDPCRPFHAWARQIREPKPLSQFTTRNKGRRLGHARRFRRSDWYLLTGKHESLLTTTPACLIENIIKMNNTTQDVSQSSFL
jgi:hypothetical protein